MDFNAKVTDISTQRSSCAVVAIYKDGKLSPAAAAINKANGKIVEKLIKQGDIQGKAGDTLMLHNLTGVKAERVLLLGLGEQKKGELSKKKEVTNNDYRSALQKAATAVKASKAKDATLYLGDIALHSKGAYWHTRQAAEIFAAAHYQFDQCKSKKDDAFPLKRVTLDMADKKLLHAAKKGIAAGTAIAKGSALTRDLGNLPGNFCTPSYLAKEAKRLARNQSKLSTKVLEEKQMRELGMGSLLSVSAGSDEPAKLIVMEYKNGPKSQKPIVLVGKGITFDTGGISLKPGAGMDEMKFDMCGAASVLGTMQALIEMQLPLNVVAIIAASENMPNGKATKPGDIVTSMSGQTIEVLNTDAEGRLVLCDALTYAERFKPQAVVDVATLTGACVIALGKHATGLYSNKDELAEELLDAGKMANDKAWHMPLWDEYQKQLDSNFADMGNIGGRDAGSVTAACFLSRFAKSYDWAHLDIAGTAWLSGGAKGATGRPVGLLTQFLLNKVGH